MMVDFGTVTEMNATDSKLDGAKLKVSVAAGTTKIDTADLLPATSTLAICDERCCDQRHCYCLRLQEVRQLAEKALTHNGS